ncbi:hypothetical protein AALP_AAs46979U000100 [Arabis alpina]|uniref:Uncharacterized protein n=1 Tax=Arabis alpina TaxID=50452 RepID=A0A087G1J1_ARAAL|nr:hypothetical protein AALP_AAs46979U000100 [Arabis alpina]
MAGNGKTQRGRGVKTGGVRVRGGASRVNGRPTVAVGGTPNGDVPVNLGKCQVGDTRLAGTKRTTADALLSLTRGKGPAQGRGKGPAVDRGKGICTTLNPRSLAVPAANSSGEASPRSVRSRPNEDLSPRGSLPRQFGDQGTSSNASNRSSQDTVSMNRPGLPQQFGLSIEARPHQQRSEIPHRQLNPPRFQMPMADEEPPQAEPVNNPGHGLEDFDQELEDLLHLPGRENLTLLSPHPVPGKTTMW